MNRPTILDDGQSAYVPQVMEGTRHDLFGEGIGAAACEAFIGSSHCLVRKGVGGHPAYVAHLAPSSLTRLAVRLEPDPALSWTSSTGMPFRAVRVPGSDGA